MLNQCTIIAKVVPGPLTEIFTATVSVIRIQSLQLLVVSCVIYVWGFCRQGTCTTKELVISSGMMG